jgi:hypothetical protein
MHEKKCGTDIYTTKDFVSIFKCFSYVKADVEPVLGFIGGYLLPVLYGTLGAVVYILRNVLIARFGIVNVYEALLDAPIRIGLGGLTGLAVGWFNPSSEIAQLATTPFALAFVAGFSLDIVFSFLERVIYAFSGPSTAGSK